jgi:creatinine amidohydrolase/Fe(II)-dependent formamide hydrolase-like protein
MSIRRKVRWEEMLPDEFLEAMAACPVCYLAYGLAEPHGAYNALGLDWLKAFALCERAAAAHGGIVAPPFCWHVQEAPHFDWCAAQGVSQPLASSIPPDLFLHIVLHQLRVVDARGFRVAILVTGHYGGTERDMRLLCDYYLRRSGTPLNVYCIADWEAIEYGDYRGDHAGICETQQLMALRPGMVDLSQSEPSPRSGPWAGVQFPDSTGQCPTPDVGEQIVSSQVAHLGSVVERLLADYEHVAGWTAPSQNDVEALWRRFERSTRKYWVMSTTFPEEYRHGPPPFPGWQALGE